MLVKRILQLTCFSTKVHCTLLQSATKSLTTFSRLFSHHQKMGPSAADNNETFSYFGYGSNLLAARIHLQNPSAVFRAIARLDGYRLEFDRDKSEVWRGASATITESPDDHVWGVVWTMNKADLASLDIQEGVDSGIYEPIVVEVTSEQGEQLICRTYHLLQRGSADRRPSPQYLDIIIRGAVEHSLPEYYISKLRFTEHNGFPGPVPLYDHIVSSQH